MILENRYFYFVGELPHKFCDEVLKYGKSQNDEQALIGDISVDRNIKKQPLTKKEIKRLHKKRKSNVVWMNEPWVKREIFPFIRHANKAAKWNFDWDYSEACQFTKYEKGQFYDWHADSWDKPYNHPGKGSHGKIRKLSVTISLNDGSEYEGGELELELRNKEPGKKTTIQCKEILPKGSVIVFPSFIWHRVKPVTKGTRYSLVMWNLGYPFR
jgi:PKHD-type hydroxylase